MRFHRVASLLLLIALRQHLVQGVEASGDHVEEVMRRAEEHVQTFFRTPLFPAAQVARAFATDYLNDSQDGFNNTRLFLFTQFVSAENVVPLENVAMSFADGRFVSYQDSGATLLVLENATQPCVNTSVLSPCATVFSVDEDGEPIVQTGYVHVNVLQLSWFQRASTHNETLVPLSVGSNGKFVAVQAQRVVDEFGSFVGVATAGLEILELSTDLSESFSASDTVVYITTSCDEQQSEGENCLVAASTPDLIASSSTNGTLTLTPSTSTTNWLISKSAAFLKTAAEIELDLKEMPVLTRQGFIVFTASINVSSIAHWTLVVAEEHSVENDYIEVGSAAFVAVCVVASVVGLKTIGLMCWLIRFRKLFLWKAAQPFSMMMILMSNMLCVGSAFVIMGPPSETMCMLRQWWIMLAVTWTLAAFIGKILRVFALANVERGGKIQKRTFSNGTVVGIVSSMLMVQVVILAVWTAAAPVESELVYEVEGSNEDVVSAHIECESASALGNLLTLVYLGILLAIGCALSFITRRMSPLFAESRALFLTFAHAAALALVLMLMANSSVLEFKNMMLTIICAILWFTLSTQALLFWPRLYWQVKIGDLTFEQARAHLVQNASAAVVSFGGVNLNKRASDSGNAANSRSAANSKGGKNSHSGDKTKNITANVDVEEIGAQSSNNDGSTSNHRTATDIQL